MKSLKILLPYLKKYKSILILGFIFVTVSNVCSTTLPRIVGIAIDDITSLTYNTDTIIKDIAIMIGLTAFSGLFMFLTRRTIIVTSRKIEYDMRVDFFKLIADMPLQFFNKNSTGTIISYSTNDIAATREFLGPAIMYTANTVTTFIFSFYYLLSINVSLTFLALIPLPVISILTYIVGRKIHFAFKDVQQQFSVLSSVAQEAFSGIRIIKSFNREEAEGKVFLDESKVYFKKNLRFARIFSVIMPLFLVLVGLSQVIILGFGGQQVIKGTATLGELTQFFIYLNLLIWPIAAIGWITGIIQRAAASASRLELVFNELKENSIKEVIKDEIKGDIQFKDICLKYNSDYKYVLKNINFKIKQGESIGIIGKVASGKSSIVMLLQRLYEASSGEILLDGKNIFDFPLRQLRQSIAFVQQEPFLFSATITENLRFAKPDASDEEIRKVCQAAHLLDEIKTFPEQFNTLLGERGITLSGGQKQRLAIARALLKDAPILIIDDGLSAVDTETEKKILNELSKEIRKRTTIIISHRISSIINCDNIIYLENGEILEMGTNQELIENQGKYFEIYESQRIEEEINSMI
ncbi:MAG TPA: ABC transporter ATP-binding protein [Candidatus Kapabacteria bacterium]|nr:ABC transporter ATP-binding protein [Candidatus Kapabacteria bacterium]HPO63600.1 ABC transporter ATP-binding protein [Candidatus Kapabacteria bacterium]